jgi:hypothetical protein
VPYFYLAGVSKSGTSDLYDVIARHPDVIRTAKEQHWFDRDRYHTSAHRQKGVLGYNKERTSIEHSFT